MQTVVSKLPRISCGKINYGFFFLLPRCLSYVVHALGSSIFLEMAYITSLCFKVIFLMRQEIHQSSFQLWHIFSTLAYSFKQFFCRGSYTQITNSPGYLSYLLTYLSIYHLQIITMLVFVNV